MYQKFCNNSKLYLYTDTLNTKSGLILVDVLLAFSLAGLFVILIASSNMKTLDIFNFARERDQLIDLYIENADLFIGLLPYEHKLINVTNIKSGTQATISGEAKWYGNDRIETKIIISRIEQFGNISNMQSASSELRDQIKFPFKQQIVFSAVRTYPFASINDAIGTELCSVNFKLNESVGSYSFLYPKSRKYGQIKIETILLPIPQINYLTDIKVKNNIAYISADSNVYSDPDIMVFDISNINNPILLSSINTGPGISAFTIAGNYIYAAAASTAAQLHIISIDSLSSISLRNKYQVPLPYATATPPFASSIFFDKNYIYLGMEKWVGEEFLVLDIYDPYIVVKASGLETNTKINKIFVRDNKAYLASSDDKQLRVIDIDDISRPKLANFFSPSGWERQEGKSINYFEDSISLGRTNGGFNIAKDHELFNWSSTSTIQNNLGSNNSSSDIPGGVYGLINDREFTFIASRQKNREIQIYNKLLSSSTVEIIPLPSLPSTMSCDLSSIYILSNSTPIIYKINFQKNER